MEVNKKNKFLSIISYAGAFYRFAGKSFKIIIFDNVENVFLHEEKKPFSHHIGNIVLCTYIRTSRAF
jgi:hypothetical protein